MKYGLLVLSLMVVLDVHGMDIVKTLKVTQEPKTPYYRKMDQAIRVQMPTYRAQQYLHQIGHPCCKDT